MSTSSKAHRYKIDLPVDPSVRRTTTTIDLSLVDGHGDLTRARVSVPHSRRLQAHGWEPIRLQSPNGHSALAYRVLVGRTQPSKSETDGIPDQHDNKDVIMILCMPPASDFMAQLPDSLALGDLTLPGTHETCALYGGEPASIDEFSLKLGRPDFTVSAVRYGVAQTAGRRHQIPRRPAQSGQRSTAR